MKKPQALKPGDKVAIVSLSSGMLGDKDQRNWLQLGTERLEEFELVPVFMPNSLKGSDFLMNYPEAKAEDLKAAFKDDEIKGIISAVGGVDTYQTLQFLLEDEEFIQLVRDHPKVFIGSSDTTINHLMFYQLGLNTFYGHSLLVDFAELANEMLPYSKASFEGMFINPEQRKLTISETWYDSRTDFSEAAIGTNRVSHQEHHGYEVLRGKGVIQGRLLGGCLDSFYSGIVGYLADDEPYMFEEYKIIPKASEWTDKILFLETSGDQPNPKLFKAMVNEISKLGIFQAVKGIIFGKPHNEAYYEEYKQILLDATEAEQTPIIYNVNFGHAQPKAIIPYGIMTEVNFDKKTISFMEKWFS